MNRWSLRQVFVLILAVFVTTGMGFTVVRANEMALKMAMPSDMGAAGQNGCAHCPDGLGKSGAKAMACASLCQAPLMAHQEAAPPILTRSETIGLASPSFAAARCRLILTRQDPPTSADVPAVALSDRTERARPRASLRAPA